MVEGPVTYDFTIHLRAHDHTTWFWMCLGTTFGHFLGLSQFHGHGSWLVCEVALRTCTPRDELVWRRRVQCNFSYFFSILNATKSLIVNTLAWSCAIPTHCTRANELICWPPQPPRWYVHLYMSQTSMLTHHMHVCPCLPPTRTFGIVVSPPFHFLPLLLLHFFLVGEGEGGGSLEYDSCKPIIH